MSFFFSGFGFGLGLLSRGILYRPAGVLIIECCFFFGVRSVNIVFDGGLCDMTVYLGISLEVQEYSLDCRDEREAIVNVLL